MSRLAGADGIRQFLDLGTGLPTAENVHQIARRADPGARVVYVDHDPVVLAHARDLLTGGPEGAPTTSTPTSGNRPGSSNRPPGPSTSPSRSPCAWWRSCTSSRTTGPARCCGSWSRRCPPAAGWSSPISRTRCIPSRPARSGGRTPSAGSPSCSAPGRRWSASSPASRGSPSTSRGSSPSTAGTRRPRPPRRPSIRRCSRPSTTSSGSLPGHRRRHGRRHRRVRGDGHQGLSAVRAHPALRAAVRMPKSRV